MKRKTFIKCVMSMGVDRNTANRICNGFIAKSRRNHGESFKWLTWAYILQDAMHRDFAFSDKFKANPTVFAHYMDDNSEKMFRVYCGEFYCNR